MESRRAVIFGSNGQLGSDLLPALENANWSVVPLTRNDADVTDHSAVNDLLVELRPTVVINTTAFHQVDVCESKMQNAFEVNAFAVHNLAAVCESMDSKLVHVSTDYVYGGDRSTPFVESDATCPQNIYGLSKATGEILIQLTSERHLIVRSSALFGVAGSSGKGGNFVETMLRLGRERGEVAVVDDQITSPTFTVDLAQGITRLVDADASGVVHVAGGGSCTWFEFAQEIFRSNEMDVSMRTITTAESGAVAIRPAYSVLASERLALLNVPEPRPWAEALRDYLVRRKQRE